MLYRANLNYVHSLYWQHLVSNTNNGDPKYHIIVHIYISSTCDLWPLFYIAHLSFFQADPYVVLYLLLYI